VESYGGFEESTDYKWRVARVPCRKGHACHARETAAGLGALRPKSSVPPVDQECTRCHACFACHGTSDEPDWMARRRVRLPAPLPGVQEGPRLPRKRDGHMKRMAPPRALSATESARSATPATPAMGRPPSQTGWLDAACHLCAPLSGERERSRLPRQRDGHRMEPSESRGCVCGVAGRAKW
jgi:hypothetical protein